MAHKTGTLRQEVLALYLAMRHPATPWYAKALAAAVVIYALSPLDVIPDVVPVLGLFDDLVLLPLGVLAVRRIIPAAVLAECRRQSAQGVRISGLWKWTGGLLIGSLWLGCLGVVIWLLWRGWCG